MHIIIKHNYLCNIIIKCHSDDSNQIMDEYINIVLFIFFIQDIKFDICFNYNVDSTEI